MNPPPVATVMSKLGWAACGVAGLGAVIMINSCWPTLTALVASSTPQGSALEDPKLGKERFKVAMDSSVASVKGRSAFYPPPRPTPPPVDPPPHRDEPPRPTPPPAKPTRYGGPGIQAIINGSVWFADGARINVGDSTGTGSSKVTVVAADNPYAVKLHWQEMDWDVPLFERDAVIYPTNPIYPANPTSPTSPTPSSDSGKAAEIFTPAASPTDSKPADTKATDKPTEKPADKPAEAKPADHSTPAAAPADKKDEGSNQ